MTDVQLLRHLKGLSPEGRAAFAGSATGKFQERVSATLAQGELESIRTGVTTVEHIRPAAPDTAAEAAGAPQDHYSQSEYRAMALAGSALMGGTTGILDFFHAEANSRPDAGVEPQELPPGGTDFSAGAEGGLLSDPAMRTLTGLSVDVMITEAVMAGGAALSGALRSGELAGAAGRLIDYPPNSSGVVRSLDEAQHLARQAGVDLDPELYRVVLDPSLPYNIRAQYFARESKEGTFTLSQMQTREGRFVLKVNPSILGSDQEIVGTFAHEVYETQALADLFDANGGRLTARQLAEAINMPYGHLHQAAEAHETAVVRRFFGGK